MVSIGDVMFNPVKFPYFRYSTIIVFEHFAYGAYDIVVLLRSIKAHHNWIFDPAASFLVLKASVISAKKSSTLTSLLTCIRRPLPSGHPGG